METKDVFISYKSEEFDDANWVKATLERNGISCWMAPASIPGGSSYAAEIPQAIRGCKVFVLILSKQAQASQWVPKELDQAINCGKTVMPFMLEDCALQDDFNFYLTNIQRYAAYESKSAAMEKMLREIRAVLGMGPQAAPEKEEAAAVPAQEPPAPSKGAAPKAPAASKKKKPIREKNNKGKGRRLKPLLIAGIAVLVLILIGVGIRSTRQAGRVTIAGKEYDKETGSVYLTDCTLTEADIAAFAKLSELRSISLNGCTFQSGDLSPLAAPTVTSLSLADCGLTAEQLASLDFANSPLYSLNLSGNGALTSLEPLAPLAGTLNTLNVSGTGVSDLSLLTGFAGLRTLRADDNGITDLSPLSACVKLEELSLNGNRIADLSALGSCVKLAKLYVNGNQLTSLDGLEPCIELKEIQAGSNQLTDINGLTNATLLSFVFLNDNQIEDISVLEKSAAYLQKLYLRNNQLYSIDAVGTMSELRYLNVDGNDLSGLMPLYCLGGCPKLIGLSAADCGIAFFSGLEALTELTYLDLSGNDLLTIEMPAMKAGESVFVDLSENGLLSLELSGEYNYRCLSLYGNGINDYTSVYATNGSVLTLDYSDSLDPAALKETGYYDIIIVDCPLDKQVSVRETLGGYRTSFVSGSDPVKTVDGYVTDAVKGVPDYY